MRVERLRDHVEFEYPVVLVTREVDSIRVNPPDQLFSSVISTLDEILIRRRDIVDERLDRLLRHILDFELAELATSQGVNPVVVPPDEITINIYDRQIRDSAYRRDEAHGIRSRPERTFVIATDRIDAVRAKDDKDVTHDSHRDDTFDPREINDSAVCIEEIKEFLTRRVVVLVATTELPVRRHSLREVQLRRVLIGRSTTVPHTTR